MCVCVCVRARARHNPGRAGVQRGEPRAAPQTSLVRTDCVGTFFLPSAQTPKKKEVFFYPQLQTRNSGTVRWRDLPRTHRDEQQSRDPNRPQSQRSSPPTAPAHCQCPSGGTFVTHEDSRLGAGGPGLAPGSGMSPWAFLPASGTFHMSEYLSSGQQAGPKRAASESVGGGTWRSPHTQALQS